MLRQSGVVKESLRLMHGIIIGPPRVVPASGAQIDGHYVPPKVCIGRASSFLCTLKSYLAWTDCRYHVFALLPYEFRSVS